MSTKNKRERLAHDQYTVGWICALQVELEAARHVLDVVHEEGLQADHDGNTYTLATIGCHNIVVTCLPRQEFGIASAAIAATNMKRTFKGIVHIFIVGTAGAAPRPAQTKTDIRLGDVVVGTQVVQYDLMKIEKRREVHRIIKTARPPSTLLEILPNAEREDIYIGTSHLPIKPPVDLLFENQYEHNATSPDSRNCRTVKQVDRQLRPNPAPKVHFGTIASANIVMKYGSERDKICNELSKLGFPDILCYEMESAGLIGSLEFTAIRGISDYADSHKNNEWKEYASASAASYAKDLLAEVPKAEAGVTKERPPTRIWVTIDGKEYVLGTAYKGKIDPVSVVDVMKSFGLDSSQTGRRIYATQRRIRGKAGDPGWNMRIRHDILKKYGVEEDS